MGALPWFEVSLRGVTAARLKGSVEIGVTAGAHGSISDPLLEDAEQPCSLSLRFHVLPYLLNRRPILHPEVPVIAPKPAPHGALGGAEFGGHLGERLGAPTACVEVSVAAT